MKQSVISGIQDNLKKILAPFFGFFKESADVGVVGVDVGASSIKVVQLKKKHGKAILETYGEIALGPYGDLAIGQAVKLPQEKIEEALTDVLREANVTARNAGLSAPLTSSLVLVIEMPNVREKQLKEMVPIEARKYIPIPIGEVSLDWSVIAQDFNDLTREEELSDGNRDKRRSKIKVLIAVIHNDAINALRSLATNAGLNISFLEIEVFSSIRVLVHKERTPVLILDLGAGSTKLSIVDGGVAQSTHIINRGSQDMTIALSRSQGISILRAEEMKRELGLSNDPKNKDVAKTIELILRNIFIETNKLLLQYEKNYNKTISKVILSGGGSLLKGIVDIAQKNFDTEVVYGDPFSLVETPAFLDPILKEVGPNFAVSLGVALRKLQETK